MSRGHPDRGDRGDRGDDAPAEALSRDTLLGGRVRLDQPASGYRVAIDPVLLAAAVPVERGARVLDLGCGVGAAGLCLLARRPGVSVTGLEIQSGLAALAGRNAALNGCADHFQVVEGDVLAPPEAVPAQAFDRVMLNPPYVAAGRGRAAGGSAKAIATHEGAAGLADWLGAALALVKPRGSITVIHRADRLHELLARLHGEAGDIRVFPLWPAPDRPAKRVLVAARKAVAGPLVLAPGLVLHGPDGRFTAAAEAVLRDAAALEL